MHINDVEEVKRIYDTYGKYFVHMEENNLNRKKLSEILCSMIGNIKGKKMLDAGCGIGNDCKMFSRLGSEIVGIDVSEKMIEMARENCKNSEVELHIKDMENTGFQNGEFDIIIAAFSLLYTQNLSEVIKEFRRILKKKGELYIIISHPIRKMIKYTKNYFDVGKHWEKFGEMKFFNYYRTMEEYINTLAFQDFVIKEIREPKPIETDENTFPHYLIIKSINGG